MDLRIAAHADDGLNEEQAEEKSQGNEQSLDIRALAIFLSNRTWSKKTIAEHLGCNEKSLAPKRCPMAQAAAIAAQAAPPSLRGTKDANGSVEAWIEE